LGLSIIGLGLIMRDGLAIMVGTVLAVVWAACVISLYVFFGLEGIHALRSVL
jgi:hypothetical protein